MLQQIEPYLKLVPAILLVVTVIGILVGWLKYRISLFQPLEKIAHDQREYRRKAEQEKLKKVITERHISLGNELIEIGQFDEAKAEFLAALSVDSINLDASMGLFKSQILTDKNLRDTNIEVMKKKIDVIFQYNAQDPHGFYFLGMSHKDHDTREAMLNFKEAIRLKNNFADAHFRIGMLHETNDQLKTSDAFHYYETAYQISPLNPTYLNNLAYQYLQSNKYKLAVEYYTKLIQYNPNDLLPKLTLSHALLRQNKFGESARYINDFIQKIERDTLLLETKLNNMQWFFEEFDKRKILLDSTSKKMCYAYFNGFYKNSLNNNIAKAHNDLQKGINIFLQHTLECESVKRLIEFEISKYLYKTRAPRELLGNILQEFYRAFEQETSQQP
ncbi:MAG: tetratricopeptide repeat protein [Chitinophagaceae bacterium]